MADRPSDWGALFRDGRGIYTVLLNLGIGLHAVDVFVISSVMPTVVGEIGGAAYYAWSTMLYMAASIVGAASGAPLKTAYGPNKGYAIGGIVFMLGSIGCGASPTMLALLIARTVQGLGGGIVISQSMALISELYPIHLRTRILAIVSGVWGVAALIGPMVGGVFAEIGWWRGAFWVTVPVILTFTALALRTLPGRSHDAAAVNYPLARVMLLAGGVLCAGVTGNVESLAAKLLLLALSILLVGATFRFDSQAPNRLFPPQPLSVLRPVGAIYWILLLFSITHTSIGIFLPLVLQVLHGVSPLAAGYGNAVFAVSWTVASFIAAGWRGPAESAALIGGPVLVAVSLLAMTVGAVEFDALVICALAGTAGFGIGLANIHLAAMIMRIAEPGHESLTASSIPTIRSLGISFGAAGAGLIANAAGLGTGITTATVAATATWVYGITALAPVICVLLTLRILRLAAAKPARP
ncbi:MAG: MFS transporter [Dongiaceae bacterium]